MWIYGIDKGLPVNMELVSHFDLTETDLEYQINFYSTSNDVISWFFEDESVRDGIFERVCAVINLVGMVDLK